MGVYINMEKPKECGHCDMFIEHNSICHCYLTGSHITFVGEVADDCPLTEIVTCRDCKNSHMTYDGKCKYCDLILDDDDNYIECYFDGDHFCGFGERRE